MGAFTDSGTRHRVDSFRSYNVTTKLGDRLIFDRKHGIASEMGSMLKTSSPCFARETKHAKQQHNRTSEFRHEDTATTGARPPADALTWQPDVPSLQ